MLQITQKNQMSEETIHPLLDPLLDPLLVYAKSINQAHTNNTGTNLSTESKSNYATGYLL